MNRLNEELLRVPNMDEKEKLVKEPVEAVDPSYNDAINGHEKLKKNVEDSFKEQEKEKEAFIRDTNRTEVKTKTTSEMKKMKLSESLFEDFDKKEEVVEELEEEDEDGWGDTIETALEEFFDLTEKVAYEVRHCVRGTHAVRGNKVEDLVSVLNSISDELTDAIDTISNEADSINEATAVAEPTIIYKKKRPPLAEIIMAELSEGEVVYRKSPEGKLTPTNGPHLNIDDENVGANSDDKGEYIIAWVDTEELAKDVAAIGDKYSRETIIGNDKYVADTPWFTKIYITDADWEEPFVDPNAPTR